jgi:hypothetical protein
MEFMNRSQQAPAAGAAAGANAGSTHRGAKGKGGGLFKVGSVALLFSATILVVALLLSLVFGNVTEGQYVKGDLQAVFLNNGQVYFGSIKNLNDKYVRLDNIYYLRVNQQVQPNQNNNNAANQDISLVKLGCELHGPADEMLINRDQVTFWGNLKGDGQVAKAVTEYVKQNPNGQKCTTPTTNTNTNTNTKKQ